MDLHKVMPRYPAAFVAAWVAASLSSGFTESIWIGVFVGFTSYAAAAAAGVAGRYLDKRHRYADASTAQIPTVCRPSGVL